MGNFMNNEAHFERPTEEKNEEIPSTMTKGKNLNFTYILLI